MNPVAAKDTTTADRDLKVGMLVTMSANRTTGDRSLVYSFWEILGINDGHALLACRGPNDVPIDANTARLVPLAEYEFYPADHLASMIGSACPKSP